MINDILVVTISLILIVLLLDAGYQHFRAFSDYQYARGVYDGFGMAGPYFEQYEKAMRELEAAVAKLEETVHTSEAE